MENNKRTAQVDRAIAYMRKHGSLTSLEALTELGILSKACTSRPSGKVAREETGNIA